MFHWKWNFPKLLQNLKKSVICRETPERKNRPEKNSKKNLQIELIKINP